MVPDIDTYLVPLDEVSLADAGRVGRKAAALGALLAAGFPVSPGLCLTTAAFHLALADRQPQIAAILAHYDLADPGQAGLASTDIQALLADLIIPQPARQALEAALATQSFAGQPLAARSSATAEDLAGASFAGQYASQLGLRNLTDLLAAILDCWRSFFSPHALSARAIAGALAGSHAMAVLIQPVIPAECAGVCLTVDPVRLEASRLYISAVWGLGAGLVDGSLNPDTAWLKRADLQVLERRVVAKPEQLQLHPERGLQRLPVPDERIRAACLPETWLKQVARLGLAAEQMLGAFQEVEWAIADSRLFLLQSRPVTGLPPELNPPLFPLDWPDPSERQAAWLPVPLGDGQPLLPVELDYLEAGAASKVEAAEFSGAPTALQVKTFNGYPYYRQLPSRLSPGDQRVRRQLLLDLAARLRREGQTSWDYWGPEVISATKRLAAFDLEQADGPALAEHLEDCLGALRRHWVIHALLWTDTQELFLAALQEISGRPQPELERLAHYLVQGEENALTRLIDDLYALAGAARLSPSLAELLSAERPDPLAEMDRLAERLSEPERAAVIAFREQFQRFLAAYGDRTGKGFGSENTVLSPTWRESPALVLHLLAPYLDPAVEPPAQARQRVQLEREAKVAELLAACPDPALRDRFLTLLSCGRREATVLEEHNHYIDQKSDGQLRAALLAAGRRLAASGLLENALEVFWLRLGEIAAALRGQPHSPLTKLIADRREQHARWANLQPPPFLGLPEKTLPERPPYQDEITIPPEQLQGRLTGLGASPGRCQGRARLVPSTQIAPSLSPGDILVAENAGPLWTPYFPILAGIVLDQGDLSQHAAATAREYGLPAVIGVRDATQRIPEGAWLAVDGTAGTVEIGAYSSVE